MRKIFALLSLLVTVSLVLAACGPGTAPATSQPSTDSTQAPTDNSGSAHKSKDPTTFTYADADVSIDTLDPALAYDTASGEVIQNTYETLVFYDGEATDKFVPVLAESWDVSADGTV